MDGVTDLTFCGVEVIFPCRWALCIVGWETGLPLFGRGGVLPQVSSEFVTVFFGFSPFYVRLIFYHSSRTGGMLALFCFVRS